MKKRNNFTTPQKVSILRRHLLKQEAVSDICGDVGIHPTLYCRWQKIFFEQGENAFNTKPKAPSKAKDRQIEALETKLSMRNELVSEFITTAWENRCPIDKIQEFVGHSQIATTQSEVNLRWTTTQCNICYQQCRRF